MKNPRLFLAAAARLDDYAGIQHDFETLVRGRWTPQRQLHATVLFFGQDYAEDELLQRLESVDISAETSQIGGLGFFKHNRILYARTANASLQRLCQNVSTALQRHPTHFSPHVTLMRVKALLDERGFYKRLETYRKRPIGELSSRIGLFSSRLSSDGAEYTLVREWA